METLNSGTRLTDDSFPNSFKEFVYTGHYARWMEEQGRREYWPETVSRYINHMVSLAKERHGYEVTEGVREDLFQAILNQEILPSMRALMTAGPALERDEVAGYNCSYLPMDSVKSFYETLYILSCGTGVGFSVESRYVQKLQEVPPNLNCKGMIVVEDSKIGWAESFRELLEALWRGEIPSWDVRKVRPRGSRLKVFGGRASGPEPLVDLFTFTIQKFLKAKGRKLTSLEVMDIVCKVGEVIVSGGVRRSALICLTDLEDPQLAKAKTGKWWEDNPQRGLANISVAYDKKPSVLDFAKEWQNLVSSGSGERGIFNRTAAVNQVRKTNRRDTQREWGCNPCSEILLRPYQFCNLSTVVVRPEDDEDSLRMKVRLATILGTLQSMLTNFRYISDKWKENTEEERLLGVSMTGQFGNTLMSGREGLGTLQGVLRRLKEEAQDTNERYAEEIGIPRSKAITCIKPEGTSSQLVGTSSGMHPWHNDYFIRTARSSKDDPITQLMIDSGIPWEDDVQAPDKRVVFSFPVHAPKGAITRKDISALEHLELWKIYQDSWCEHKPSITVSVKPEEWEEVGNWVYDHFDEVSGISFLPYSDHTYRQAPYQNISEEDYAIFLHHFDEEVDWSKLSEYEKEDNTSSSKTLACSANSCEIVDLA